MVKTDKVLSQFTDIFGGLGCQEEKYSFDIDTSVYPKVYLPCMFAVTLHNSLAAELHRMEDMKIITPVSEATRWVSSVVVLKKNGKVSVCLNPNDSNKATSKDLASRLNNAKVFSVLNFQTGVWHVELDLKNQVI